MVLFMSPTFWMLAHFDFKKKSFVFLNVCLPTLVRMRTFCKHLFFCSANLSLLFELKQN